MTIKETRSRMEVILAERDWRSERRNLPGRVASPPNQGKNHMNTFGRNRTNVRPRRPFPGISALLALPAVMICAALSGCSPSEHPLAGTLSPRRQAPVEVSRVPVRICPWNPLENGKENDVLSLVKALDAGDVASVDAILSRGKVGINEAICLTENEGIRRGRIDTDKMQFIPPTIASGLGDMQWMADSYALTDKHDPALGKNDVIYLCGTPLMFAARVGNPSLVAFLLKRGANPNVFIPVQGIDEQTIRQGIDNPSWVAPRRPWTVLCALTECYVRTGGKLVENEDGCAMLLLRNGAAVPPENSKGQTALWAAAQARSLCLLDHFLAAGADPARKDDFGMTVADYVSREIQSVPYSPLRNEYERFLLALREKTGLSAGTERPLPAAAETPSRQDWANPAMPFPSLDDIARLSSTTSPAPPKRDRTQDIATLEIRLRELRSQLEDARHDANMAAISGHSTLVSQMRVQLLLSRIHECESQLLELQE